ncbi:MAG TPA: hypothetical protein VEI97_15075 [bacterium]|nr:hypothetical protein [bacterium]
MNRIMTLAWHRNIRKNRGASALEYALLIVLLVVGLVVFFRQFGQRVQAQTNTAANKINTSISATSNGQGWNGF